jgi:hypothetical protein
MVHYKAGVHVDFSIIVEYTLTALVTLAASSGFWAYIEFRQRSNKSVNVHTKTQTALLIGLAHDRIVFLAMRYIDRGYITFDEYENLMGCLIKPYRTLHGNGFVDRLVKEINTLTIKPNQSIKVQRTLVKEIQNVKND